MIKRILGYEDNSIPIIPAPSAVEEIRQFVANQLGPFSLDDALNIWLDERSKQLEKEELEDYHSHRRELMATGFIRSS